MEHADALERIEIAAAEPNGLDRLMAGDTADGAAVAGHLAGCPACVAEMARIRRTAAIARDIIGAEPDPALRDRTLAFVRSVGRDRSGAAVLPATTAEPVPLRPPSDPAPRSFSVRRPARLAWVAGIAAALIVAGTLGFAAGGASRDPGLSEKAAEIALLEQTTAATLRIGEQPDARRVALVATTTGGASGTLLFSPGTGELVVVAAGLPWEAADQEYGCWVEVNGQRQRLGKMYWGGDLAAWAGPATGLANLPPGTTFGVSLGPIGGGGPGVPVLTGAL